MNTLKKTILISVSALALCAFSNQNSPHNIAKIIASPVENLSNVITFNAQIGRND